MFEKAWPLADLDSAADLAYFDALTGGDVGIVASSPDGASKSFVMSSYWANGWAALVLPSNHNGKTCRFRIFLNRNNKNNGNLFSVFANPSSGEQVRLFLDSASKLVAYRGGTLLAQGSTVLDGTLWHDIQSEILVHSSAGVFKVYLNNNPTPEISFTGNTQGQESADVNSFFFGTSTAGALWDAYINDPILFNSDGPLNDGLIPAGTKIVKKLLNGDGASQFPGRNTGANNYGNLNDVLGNPTDDTAYVYGSTPGDENLSDVEDFTEAGTPLAIQLMSRFSKVASGQRAVETGIKIGTTEQVTERYPEIGYKTYTEVFNSSDGGSTALTASDVTNMKALARISV
jgi:hypothetical protein